MKTISVKNDHLTKFLTDEYFWLTKVLELLDLNKKELNVHYIS